ncbi:unnamed protein product [Aphanomyces euteiches]
MSAARRLRNSAVALNEGAANEIAKVAQAAEASRMLSDEAKKCDDDDDDVDRRMHCKDRMWWWIGLLRH